jgi:hypothetical protein
MPSSLNVSEPLPPSESLVALQFETVEEFQRCRDLLWEQPECFQWPDRRSLVIVVEKASLPLFAQAGLQFSERPVVDGAVSPSPEETARMREWMRKMNTRMLKGLSLEE